jgi:abhydrolase domain-containing protein 1/3
MKLLQSSTIREFDSRFTAKMFGYPSCDDYYHDATLHNKIHALRVPVLVLSAEDDPFSPSHGKTSSCPSTQCRRRSILPFSW